MVINEIPPRSRRTGRPPSTWNCSTPDPDPVDLGMVLHPGNPIPIPHRHPHRTPGFLVVCRNAKRFEEFYTVPVAGEFQSRSGARANASNSADASGKRGTPVKFSDRAPCFTGADGHSGSLERICPTASGDDPSNWISSPDGNLAKKSGGTPGQPNQAIPSPFHPSSSESPFPRTACSRTSHRRGRQPCVPRTMAKIRGPVVPTRRTRLSRSLRNGSR